MNAIKRLGVSYGKLGLSTDPDLIARRGEGVKAAADELDKAGVAPLVQAAFGVGTDADSFGFLSDFSGDPTFGVQAGDKEAELLACAIAEYEIENGTDLSDVLALTVVTCACRGIRQPALNDQLIAVAEEQLAHSQGLNAPRPKDRTYIKQPKAIADAIEAIPTGNQYFHQAVAQVNAALQSIAKYTESVAIAAAKSDEEMLTYVRRVEEEMRTYWWVTGGWSDECKGPFRGLSGSLAAICAGYELANKHSSAIGLFAAPALIDLVLERGRTDPIEEIVLEHAAVVPTRDWRKQHFATAASGPLASLLPITTALGLSSASEDADDWKPRFRRVVGLEPTLSLSATEFSMQLYRERLVARTLG
jgi:hypothetical protein